MGHEQLEGASPNLDETTGLCPRIELRRLMFPAGTLGFSLFPEILEGRQRPATILDQSLGHVTQKLLPLGVETFSDLFHLPEEELQALSNQNREIIKNGLSRYLEELVVGPEGHLLGAVFGEEARPIPREFESDRQVAVREVLETLTPRERRVLELRFGLLDGQTRTLEEVGRELAVTRERIRQIETKGLRKLRHPSRSLILGLFIPLHENSLGKQVWNIDLGWQLQEQLSPLDLRKITLEDLGLSQEALYELEEMIDNFSLDTALVRVIRWTPRGLSSLTKDDLKRTTQLLQKVNEVS